MCAKWIVSVGKVGVASAKGGVKANVAPCHFHVAAESSGRDPQWRFTGMTHSWRARHVLQDVLAKLVGNH